jgi:hypothetical protein
MSEPTNSSSIGSIHAGGPGHAHRSNPNRSWSEARKQRAAVAVAELPSQSAVAPKLASHAGSLRRHHRLCRVPPTLPARPPLELPRGTCWGPSGCHHEWGAVVGRYPLLLMPPHAWAACSPWRGGGGHGSVGNAVATGKSLPGVSRRGS